MGEVNDPLSKAFGPGKGGKGKGEGAPKQPGVKSPVQAFTIHEMIKSNKDDLVDLSKKILEKHNAS